jgi:hypothetical protein
MSGARIFATCCLLWIAACGNGSSGTTDLGSSHDMPSGDDMKLSDMSMGDMFMPDMFVPPTLDATGCATATVTLSSFYTNIINAKCATTSCHVTNGTPPNYAGGASAFKTAVVNVSTGRLQVPDLKYIVPSDLNNSFILYKVTGQQAKVPGGGVQMPQNGPPYLSAADQCTIINWVRSGAN